MGGVFARHRKLWFRVKGPSGKWTNLRSGFSVGQEELARQALKSLEETIAAGGQLPLPVKRAKAVTVGEYAERWLAERKTRGLATAEDDESRLDTHIRPLLGSMPLDEVRPRHIRDFVRSLRAREGRRGQIAPRTIRHLYFQVRSIFQDALVDELISSNPCVLKRGDLPKKVDKDPAWRVGAIFAPSEVKQLLTDARTPDDRPTHYALLFLGGMRFGESAALRWVHYDSTIRPLGRLVIARAFSTRLRKEDAVKTEMPRELPVHPLLAEFLSRWRQSGWPKLMGREPIAEDLIMPSRVACDRNRAVNLGLERFHEDLRRLELRPRRLHDARRTFITLARQGGANKEILRWVTHGGTTDIMDVYTTPSWEARCSAVLSVRVRMDREDSADRLPPTREGGRAEMSFEDLKMRLEEALQAWTAQPDESRLRRELVAMLHGLC